MFSNYEESGPTLMSNGASKLMAKFRFTNTDVTVANTLRRAILTQTPSVGFRTEPYDKSDVIISINTTPLVNEMIAHRIGMIPIQADPTTFNPELYTFELDMENNTKEMMDVRASNFKVYMRNQENPLEKPTLMDSATFFPPDPITGDTVIITRLRPQWNPTSPNERVQLRAKASISTGSENIRWSPVCQSSYEYTRDSSVEHQNDVFLKWLETHKKIDDVNTIESSRKDELYAEFLTMEIQRCYITDERGNPNDFTFHVESVGIQSVPQIVRAAIVSCEVLVAKYQDIDGILPDNVRIQPGDSSFPSFDIIFQNESHTLGNLLETWIVENEIQEESEIISVGYKVPHPLRPEMFVRIGYKGRAIDDTDVKQQLVRRTIANACRALKDKFRMMALVWDQQFTQ